jgi:hypothetical protein
MNPHSTEPKPLFDIEQIEREQVANNGYLSDSTQFMMMEMMKMGCNKFVISALLEMASVPKPFIQYMEGPVITHSCGWMDSIPDWVFQACYVERLEKIFEELKQGKPGDLATPAEALACMYPASMEAPMQSHWAECYFWCGATVIPRHRPHQCKSAEEFFASIGQQYPITYQKVKHDFEYLARDIRQKVIKYAPKSAPAGKGKGKGFAPKPEPQAQAQEPETVQVNLLDLMS